MGYRGKELGCVRSAWVWCPPASSHSVARGLERALAPAVALPGAVFPARSPSPPAWCTEVCAAVPGGEAPRGQLQVMASKSPVESPSLWQQDLAACFCRARDSSWQSPFPGERAGCAPGAHPGPACCGWGCPGQGFWAGGAFAAGAGSELSGELLCLLCCRARTQRGHLVWLWAGGSSRSKPGMRAGWPRRR